MTTRIERAYAILAVFVVLALQPSLNFWPKTWLIPWSSALIVGALIGAYQLKRIHPSIAALSAVVLSNAAMGFAYVTEGGAWSVAHVGNQAYSLASYAAVLACACLLPVIPTRKAFAMAGICVALGIVYRAFMGEPPAARWEFIGNPSMAGCYLACVLPFSVISRPQGAIDAGINIAIVSLFGAAIALTSTLSPWLCLFAVIAVAVAREDRRIIPYMVAFFVVVITFYAGIQDRLFDVEHFNGSGRFIVWRVGYEHWRDATPFTKLFGFGVGTTYINLMKWYPASDHDWWTWFHNDWLQQLIEAGVVGLAASLYVAASAFRIAWVRSTRELAALAGIATWAMVNYPARLAFTALFCGCVVVSVFRGRIEE